ncbi:OmpA family protein [Rhizobium sp. BK491]|uniref:OmpA family protein n=1 Tax=Rhizobium sp. BK491 TaxID=2587009 RepID=UPI00160944D0|nr:OmpA family protein [Rhizobium sp. BK491]MBB3566457.1 outer membrane protein OmpA-like peptidoglycan-associated protein [Rhizobium sp. BK491]
MGKRSRLFASAAFPLLSLSLAFEPAAAAALREQPIVPLNNGIAGAAATAAGTSFEVAQQEAPAAQPDEEQLKHKKPAEGGEGQKHQGGGEQQHQMKQAEPEGEPQQKAPKQQQPEAQPPKAEHQQPAEQEQPKPQKQQPAAEAPPELPKKQRQQPAEEPQAQPEEKPQPKSVAPQAEPEAPQPKPKVKQPEAKQPVEQEQPKPQKQQPAEAPQPKVEQQPATEAQPEVKPEPKAKPGSKGQQPAPAEKQAPAAGEQPNQGAQPGKQAQPEQNAQPKPQGQTEAPAKQPAAQQPAPAGEPAQGHKVQPGTQPQTQAQPGTPVTPGTEQGQKQGGDKTHGKQPQNQQQGEQPAATPQQPAQQGTPQGQPAQAGNPATPQPGKQQPANGAATPAQAGATAPAANGNGQQAGEIQLPPAEQVSPQELERRKKIAENPASANGPVILPVENGSAVLDSQKDAVRRGEHLNNGQNPAAPGAQGGRRQAGQAPQSGQAQTAPAQQPPPAYTKPPTSDAEAQRAAAGGQPQPPVKMEAVTSEQGRRIDRRPDFAPPQGTTVQTIINQDNRTIVNVDNTYVVRHDDSERFIRGGERPVYEQLPRDRYRETIDQPDGDRVVTIRNRYGDIIQRSRIDASGREYVLFYSPELESRPDNDDYYRDPGEDLPPMRLLIPLSQYIIDTASNRNADYYDFLREPPVEPVERIYSVNEVRYSARIRDKIRRIDLDTITFATGSAEIPMSQASTLRGVADGMLKIIKRDPTETFLIEGHTDAVGSAQSNLILSDQRAESVANVLTDVYGIPAENLVTQGYGEQYLKVNTLGPSQENRRVTIRRITPLVRPVASNR